MTGTRTVEIAEHAGFCFGVRRAVEALEKTAHQMPSGGEVATLGHLIHNESFVRSLEGRGIHSVTDEQALQKAENATLQKPFALIIRAHGIPYSIQQKLEDIATKNPHFTLVDCTCPFVQKLQKIALAANAQSEFFLLLGNKDHPEVKGVMSRFEGEKYTFAMNGQTGRFVGNLPTDKKKLGKYFAISAAIGTVASFALTVLYSLFIA